MWLDEELASPSLEDPDWLSFIAAYARREEPPSPEVDDDPDVTYRCRNCRDTGFVLVEKPHKTTYTAVRRCEQGECAVWIHWRDQMEEQGRRTGLRGDTELPF